MYAVQTFNNLRNTYDLYSPVLDDNKKLCLINGEIIKMTNKMNLIFETENLEFASPATVSRVGMIFFEIKCISWKTFFASYQNELRSKLNDEQFELGEYWRKWFGHHKVGT